MPSISQAASTVPNPPPTVLKNGSDISYSQNYESTSSLLSMASFGASFSSVIATTTSEDDCCRLGLSYSGPPDIETLLADLVKKRRERTRQTVGEDREDLLESLMASLAEVDFGEEDLEDDLLDNGHDSLVITRRRSFQTAKASA